MGVIEREFPMATKKKPKAEKAPKAKVEKAKAPGENKVVKAAKKVVDAARKPRDKRTDGAEDRIIAILQAFDSPVLKSELTQRMTAWTRDSRDNAIESLVKRRKIKQEIVGTGRRGRPGTQFELAA